MALDLSLSSTISLLPQKATKKGNCIIFFLKCFWGDEINNENKLLIKSEL